MSQSPGRRLATLETITGIRHIPGADAIVCARIRGWDVVVKRDEFRPGDLCIYIEVDTLVDTTDPRFAFLAPRGIRTDAEGTSGHVLKTARLRGQYSQGLALPVSSFPEIDEFAALNGTNLLPGEDITDLLPVRRWDPPMPANLAGQVNGRLPGWIPTTDEERIQNLAHILTADHLAWVATEKLDGTSTTVYVNPDNGDPASVDPAGWPGVRGVCSRNYDLTHTADQTQWRLATDLGLHDKMIATWPGQQVALQGETVGEGIQGNPLKIKGQQFALFTIRVSGTEVPRANWPAWALGLAVPVYEHLTFPATVDDASAQVDTLESLYSPGRPAEGVVWRARDTARVAVAADASADPVDMRASFKVISRRYLVKHDR